MIDLTHAGHQIQCVANFHDLIATPFHREINAICWTRALSGDFSEIVNSIALTEDIIELDQETLLGLPLSVEGQMAREILLNDLKLLKAHGAAPVLNIIKCYERDDSFAPLPTDVYSFHVDRSPIATDTFLCTYHGESSEILPNAQAIQKVMIPEIRDQLKKLYDGPEAGFASFLTENYFDLHYQATPNAIPISLGLGHMWRLAVDHPQSKVMPCVHRAPQEKNGQNRLLLIC